MYVIYIHTYKHIPREYVPFYREYIHEENIFSKAP